MLCSVYLSKILQSQILINTFVYKSGYQFSFCGAKSVENSIVLPCCGRVAVWGVSIGMAIAGFVSRAALQFAFFKTNSTHNFANNRLCCCRILCFAKLCLGKLFGARLHSKIQ